MVLTFLSVMGFVATIGGHLGARYTNRLSEAILKFVIGIKLVVITIAMFWRGIYFPLGILILTKSEVQNIFDILYGILDSA
jgi:hypothetical protein